MPSNHSRRHLLRATALAPLALSAGAAFAFEPDLQNIASDAQPIGPDERKARIARAQALMHAHNIGAVLIEPGSSLIYFTGVRWSRSERLTCVVIPVEGEPCIVTPFFEEPSVRESLGIPAEVRVWQEDEDPLKLVAGFLKDRKLAGRPVGIEETDRYFIVDGLQRAVERATGRPATLDTGGGTSDARFIARFCPVAELGGVGSTMHKVDECVPVAELRDLAGLYRMVLEESLR